jgi:hypothetical protein
VWTRLRAERDTIRAASKHWPHPAGGVGWPVGEANHPASVGAATMNEAASVAAPQGPANASVDVTDADWPNRVATVGPHDRSVNGVASDFRLISFLFSVPISLRVQVRAYLAIARLPVIERACALRLISSTQ